MNVYDTFVVWNATVNRILQLLTSCCVNRNQIMGRNLTPRVQLPEIEARLA